MPTLPTLTDLQQRTATTTCYRLASVGNVWVQEVNVEKEEIASRKTNASGVVVQTELTGSAQTRQASEAPI